MPDPESCHDGDDDGDDEEEGEEEEQDRQQEERSHRSWEDKSSTNFSRSSASSRSFSMNSTREESSSSFLLFPNNSSADIPMESRRSIIQAVSLRRGSTSMMRLQEELTVNKLRFDSLGLYGREEQTQQLLQCLNHRNTVDTNADSDSQQHQHKRQVVFVSGISGTGKSSLVECLRQPALSRNGVFISGKYDWNQRDEPYQGIAMACGALCGDILRHKNNNNNNNNNNRKPPPPTTTTRTNHDRRLSFQELRDTIVKELGSEVGVLTRVVPILEEITGAPDDVAIVVGTTTTTTASASDNVAATNPKDNDIDSDDNSGTGPAEAKNRFHYAFRRFIRIVSSYYGLVVMVLDDLQWADTASLELVQTLLTDRDNPQLLLVGCYRSNEVIQTDHPLATLIKDLKLQMDDYNFGVKELTVPNLTLEEVNQLLMDLLSKYHHETIGLAQICHKKTLGNPFFLKSFLQLLHKNLLLEYNLGKTMWVWDDNKIETKTQAALNVVDVLVLRMKEEWTVQTKLCLQVAACLGSSFAETVLSRVWDRLLQGDQNILLEFNNNNKLETDVESSNNNENEATEAPSARDILHLAVEGGYLKEEQSRPGEYCWVHDKIQESAYSLTSPEELSSLQCQIGKILISELSHQELASTIFVAVNLLNGGPIPVDPLESAKRAQLNLHAAEKAVALAAMESAAKYASIGIECLPNDCWSSHPQLALDLYSTAGVVEGYLGKVESMEFHCNTVLEHDDIPLLGKVRAYNAVLDSVANQNRATEARKLCIDVLKRLGCKFPKNPVIRAIRISSGLRNLRKMTHLRTAEDLSKTSKMQDPIKIEAMKLLEKLATYCYLTGRWTLYILVILREVDWTDRFGMNETAAHAFGCAGIVLTNMLGEFKQGSIYGQHALDVVKKLQVKRLEAPSKFVAFAMVLHWTQPSHLAMRPLLESYESGMETGNLEYAMYGIYSYITVAMQSGRSLDSIEKDCRKYAQQMVELKREFTRVNLCCVWQTVLNLKEQSEDPCNFMDGVIEEEHFLPTAIPFHTSLIRCYQRYISTWFGEHQRVAELALAEGLPLAKVSPGAAAVLLEAFFTGVSLFAAARETKRHKYTRHGMKILATIKKWVEKGNPNVRHYEALLEAEVSALKKKVHVAKKNYEIAIALASRGGFIQDAALAHERYGDFLLDHDRQDTSYHIGEAIRLHKEWGAQAMVFHLEKKYADLRESPSVIAFVH